MDRPYVIINSAMTVDGKIDTFKRQGVKISSQQDWERVDQLRASSEAVMVGGHTLLDEDPSLTIKLKYLREDRLDRGLPENPMKVGVVTQAFIQNESRFILDGPAQVIIFTTNQTPSNQIMKLEEMGVKVLTVGDDKVDLHKMMLKLAELGANSILVEGGGTLNAALIQDKMVDEIYVYIAPIIFGGSSSPTLADGPGMLRESAVHLELLSVDQGHDHGIVVHYKVIN